MSLVYKSMERTQKNYESEEIKDSNDVVAVDQRKLEFRQLERKTNTNCLVNEQVYIGGKIRADIMETGVPGQECAEGNAAEKKKVKKV
ncbi:hypothetical protein Tco_0247266 [Tanacetum coccineum]